MKHLKIALVLGLLCLFVIHSGCKPARRETTPAPPSGIELLISAKRVFEFYARGEEPDIDRNQFEEIITALRPTHPDKADVLEKGYAEVTAAPNNSVKGIANKILTQLGDIGD